MKIFRVIFFATEKTHFQSFSELKASRLFRVFLLSFLSSKFILQLQHLSLFSFSLVFVFELAFVCSTLQYTTCKIKLYFLEKLLQVLTYFAKPYIFYLKHSVNYQNSGTDLNCRLSYGTNFFQGQNRKNKYRVLNTNFHLKVLLFLPSKFQKLIFIFCS